jgi:MFS family permease
VVFKVDRDGEILTVPVVLDPYREIPDVVTLLVVENILAIVFLGIGFVLWFFSDVGKLYNRLFGASWMLAAMAISAGGPGLWSGFYFSHPLTVISFALLNSIFLTAHIYFPSPALSSRTRQVIINSAAVISILLVILVLICYVVSITGGIVQWNVIDSINYLIFLLFLASIIGNILLLISRIFSKDQSIRRQVSILLWGTLLGFSPFLLLALLPSVLLGYPLVSNVVHIPFLAFVPLAYAYVIKQQDLFRVDIFINRSLVIFIMTLIIMTVVGTIMGFMIRMMSDTTMVALLTGVTAAVVVFPSMGLRDVVQRGVDRVLFTGDSMMREQSPSHCQAGFLKLSTAIDCLSY